MATPAHRKTAQIIDFFSGKRIYPKNDKRIIRFTPEYDQLAMLYGNDLNPGKLFSMKVMGWGLQQNGEVVGLVPWLNTVVACPDLNDPLNGHWEGYYKLSTGQVFYRPPPHKKIELQTAAKYHPEQNGLSPLIIQEIPDTIGTHAVLVNPQGREIIVNEVVSWRLLNNGCLQGMVIEQSKVKQTPVLLGDTGLYTVQEDSRFTYFFQYRIANKIKMADPETMKVITWLMGF